MQSPSVLAAIAPLTAFLFMFITYREILMDINDRVGDAAASVHTIPVTIGPLPALAVATGCLLVSTVAGFAGLHAAAGTSAIAAAAGGGAAVVQALAGGAFMLGMLPAWLDVCNVLQSSFNEGVVAAAIDNAFKPIAVGLILLTVFR